MGYKVDSIKHNELYFGQVSLPSKTEIGSDNVAIPYFLLTASFGLISKQLNSTQLLNIVKLSSVFVVNIGIILKAMCRCRNCVNLLASTQRLHHVKIRTVI